MSLKTNTTLYSSKIKASSAKNAKLKADKVTDSPPKIRLPHCC